MLRGQKDEPSQAPNRDGSYATIRLLGLCEPERIKQAQGSATPGLRHEQRKVICPLSARTPRAQTPLMQREVLRGSGSSSS
jgi:hypothetical protein